MNGIVMLNMLNGPVSAFLKPKSKFFGNHVMDIMDVASLVNILKIVKILRIYPPYSIVYPPFSTLWFPYRAHKTH